MARREHATERGQQQGSGRSEDEGDAGGDGEWVQMYDYEANCGIEVYGSLAVTDKSNAVVAVQPRWGNTTPLQIELDQRLVRGLGGIEAVESLILSHNAQGGTLINMNVLSKEQVLQAHENPARHPDLVDGLFLAGEGPGVLPAGPPGAVGHRRPCSIGVSGGSDHGPVVPGGHGEPEDRHEGEMHQPEGRLMAGKLRDPHPGNQGGENYETSHVEHPLEPDGSPHLRQPLQGIQNRAHASIRPVFRQRPLAQMGYRQALFLIE